MKQPEHTKPLEATKGKIDLTGGERIRNKNLATSNSF